MGLINEENILNTCAGGAFVDVSYSTRSDLKEVGAGLLYQSLGRLGILPIRFKIKTDTEIIEQDFTLFDFKWRHAAGLITYRKGRYF